MPILNGFSKSLHETVPNTTSRVRLLHLGGNKPQFRFHVRGYSEADCAIFCSSEARDDPTLWGVDDDGNECFLWNRSMAESSHW